MDIKKISIIISIILASSAFINIVLSVIVPRSEILDMSSDIYKEINRIEIKMAEDIIDRREEEKCNLISKDLISYRVCLEDIKYRSSIRYLGRNE